MRKFVFTGACLATLTFTGMASAADMPVKAPMVAAAPAYNWSGCYLGVHAGGIWGKSHVDIPLYPQNFDISMNSWVGGGQIGCNYIFAPMWLVGIEADGSWFNLNGDHSTIGLGGTERYAVKWNNSFSLRSRLGMISGNNLFYVTAGGSWAHLDTANYIPPNGGVKSATAPGWIAGLGWEHGLMCGTLRCVVGVEWLHAHYNTQNFVYLGPTSVDLTTDTIRARFSLLFP